MHFCGLGFISSGHLAIQSLAVISYTLMITITTSCYYLLQPHFNYFFCLFIPSFVEDPFMISIIAE